jgi:hypothetical protein
VVRAGRTTVRDAPHNFTMRHAVSGRAEEASRRTCSNSRTSSRPQPLVEGRHRLTVHTNLLAQPARDAPFGVRELDPLGANPAAVTILAMEQQGFNV